MYLNVFMVYFNVFIMYLNIFECIYGVLQCICNILQCIYNTFQCIYSMFQFISMWFKVIMDIVIEIHYHILIVTFLPWHAHPPTHFIFTLHNNSLTNMLYHYTFFIPFPLICSNFHTIYEKIKYQSLLFTSTHHPTFHIPCCHWLRRA
jgi:hypothetical protein